MAYSNSNEAFAATPLDPVGLLRCDPASHVTQRPSIVYNTPAVIPNIVDPQERVLVWTEGHLGGADPDHNYYFVQFSPLVPGVSRTCTVKVEDDGTSGMSYHIDLPSPSEVVSTGPLLESEAARGAPVVRFGSPRTLLFTTVTDHINRYELGADGFPVTSSDNYSVDTTPTSDPGDTNYDESGTDNTAFVDPNLDVMIIGNRCNATAGGTDCATPSDTDWGVIHAHSLAPGDDPAVQLNDPTDPVNPADPVDIRAWAYSAPVGLTSTGGPSNDLLLMASGSYEGTASALGGPGVAQDCALLTLAFDGMHLSLVDDFSDPAHLINCDTSPPGGGGPPLPANGFNAEVVPYGARSLFALRHYGMLYRMAWDNLGMLSHTFTLEFKRPPTYTYSIPPEVSPVIGTFPETPQGAYTGTLDRVMFGMQESDGNSITSGLYVAVDPQDPCLLDPATTHCEVDPADYLIDSFHAGNTGNNVVWSPGAAGVYRELGSSDLYLAFVVSTGAITYNPAPTGPDCTTVVGAGIEKPARLHIYFQQLSDPINDWEHHYIDLHDYAADPTENCYELDPLSGSFEPIQVLSGTALHGAAAYVATTDGLFWEYNTQIARLQGSGSHLLEGYSGPWPRFRKNNYGRATRY